jgi:Raf kinase inhibitor-like YbhB/YbcL family protein
MLQHLPAFIGNLLHGVRAGSENLLLQDPELAAEGLARSKPIGLSSNAFRPAGELPIRLTNDGEGLSPPLAWTGVPAAAQSLVLVAEDADSPTPHPLVHAIVWNLPAGDGGLAEGALPGTFNMGHNSFHQDRWLPPDPPTGHGPHRYYFQLVALDRTLSFDKAPGRDELRHALHGAVIGCGVLVGTYERS